MKLPLKKYQDVFPFKKETEQEKKTRVANEILLYEKKSRAWLESEPKNWTSAILRGWYKHKSLQVNDLRGGATPRRRNSLINNDLRNLRSGDRQIPCQLYRKLFFIFIAINA
jgi:hypothetical protein